VRLGGLVNFGKNSNFVTA